MKAYHKSIVEISENVARFFNAAFTKINIDGPPLDAEQIQKNPLMIVSTHRSHIDYFFVGQVMYSKGFRNLRFAAGDNLTKLPFIGPRFRKLGAFAVSRENGFRRSYIRTLCNQVMEMMKGGDIVLVFPEGGRSYSGSMLEIKGGILNSAILLQAKHPDKEVSILPMSVSYEFAPDVPWFSLLLRGKKFREKSNPFLKKMLGSIYYFGADLLAFTPIFLHRFFKRCYGEIYCDYKAPVALKEIVDIEANKKESTKDEFFAHRESLNQLSEHVYAHFISLYRILPLHLVAAAIEAEGNGYIDPAKLEVRIKEVSEGAARKKLNVKSVKELGEAEIVRAGLKQLKKYRAIRKGSGNYVIRNPEIIQYCASALKVNEEELPEK